jgi:heme/copper-type cytochrome/quinol oxidase subunit 3
MEAARALNMEPTPVVETAPAWSLPDRGKVGMLSFIIAESAIFTIFVVAYLFYLGKSVGPSPRDVLEVPIFYTICLVAYLFYLGRASRGRRRTRCWRRRSSTPSACSPAA